MGQPATRWLRARVEVTVLWRYQLADGDVALPKATSIGPRGHLRPGVMRVCAT